MLQNIHDKAKGWVAYAIVGFIAIPFTLFGIGSYLGGSNSLVAATVNGEEIPVQQVQNEVLQQRQRLAQMFGGKLPPSFSDDAIKKQVLEGIIRTTLLRQEAEKNGYRVSNEEVYNAIAEVPSYQKDGVFDEETLERQLAMQRISKSNFIENVRQTLTNQQLSQGLSQTTFLPANDVTRFSMLQNQTRDAETYTLKADDYKSEVQVSDDEVKSYYDKNISRFMTLDKVKLSYLELKQADLAKTVEVTDTALKAYYEENADRYVEPEQRKVAHILVKIDYEKDGKDAETNAQAKIDALSKQIKDGSKTFEELASTDSDDKFSSKKAGEIGFIVRGDMGPLFEKAAFALGKGDISPPVKTEAGMEIIKVLDLADRKQKTFEDVKVAMESTYQAEKAEKLFQDKTDILQTLAFENESSLDVAADGIGGEVKTSDWIEKGIPSSKNPLFSSPKLISMAFSDEVLIAGKNSELIEIDNGTVVIIRLQEHQPPKQKTLADVSKQIVDILTSQKLRKLLIDKGEQVLKSLKETSSWSAVSSIGGSEDKVEKHEALKRTDNKIALTLRNKIFSMQKPSNGKKSFDNVILPAGDYVLIGLSGVKEGVAENNKAVEDNFTQMLAQREQDAMLKAMRKEAEVELFLENIQ